MSHRLSEEGMSVADDAKWLDEATTVRRAGDVDREIGLRLRAFRTLIGVTQASLADAAGLTFQQIQKYETGKSRLSASMLCRFADILGVQPGALLPAGASDPDGQGWDVLAANQRLAYLLTRLQALPPVKFKKVLDRLERNIEGQTRHVPTPSARSNDA